MSSPTPTEQQIEDDATTTTGSVSESPTKPTRSRRRSNTSSNSSVASASSSLPFADHGRTLRAGLNFPVGLVGRSLKRGGFSQRIGGGAPVYVAAVLEYLATEVLDLAGHAADLEWRESGGESSDTTECSSRHRTRPTKTITPAHIEHAIRSDGELQRVMQDMKEIAASAASTEDEARMEAAAAASSNTDSTELDEEEEEEEEEEDDEGSQGDEEEEEEEEVEDGSEEDSQGGESQTSQTEPAAKAQTEPAEMEQIEDEEKSTTTTDSQSTTVPASATSTSSTTTTTSSAIITSPQKRKSSDVSTPAEPPAAKRPQPMPSSQIRPKPAVPLFDGTLLPTPNRSTTLQQQQQQQSMLNMLRFGNPMAAVGSFSRPVLASAVNAAPTPSYHPIPTAAIAASITPPSSLPLPAPVSASPFTDNLVALSSVMPGVDLLTCSRVLEAQQNNLAKAILYLQQQQATKNATTTQTTTPTTIATTNYND